MRGRFDELAGRFEARGLLKALLIGVGACDRWGDHDRSGRDRESKSFGEITVQRASDLHRMKWYMSALMIACLEILLNGVESSSERVLVRAFR